MCVGRVPDSLPTLLSGDRGVPRLRPARSRSSSPWLTLRSTGVEVAAKHCADSHSAHPRGYVRPDGSFEKARHCGDLEQFDLAYD